MKRKFNIRLLTLMLLTCLSSYLSVCAKDIGWGIPKSENHQQPWPGQEYADIIKNNDAFYIAPPEEMDLYLTFDCGYENGNTPLILDVLKKHKVPAIFFVTGHFMEQNPELVKRMATEGHIVGNHTYHHPDLTKVSKEKFNEELTLIENKYTEITGEEMVRFIRPPEGHFNQQVLDWSKERGYYMLLWSLAYIDWHVDQQKGWQYAYDQLMGRVHPGAIILMHSISKDNAECLDQLIPKLREEGYEFRSVQYLLTYDLPERLE